MEDTGFGISRRLLPFIFDLYAQADRTLDRAQGGLGIGLTLVRRLVELHGGTIVAASEGEGQGSTFTVRLKQIPDDAASPGLASRSERRARARRVLLIEDSADAREMLRMMLELAGHVVYDAADGAGGLELLRRHASGRGDHRHRSAPDGRLPGGQADSGSSPTAATCCCWR